MLAGITFSVSSVGSTMKASKEIVLFKACNTSKRGREGEASYSSRLIKNA
jgi:hypothetical protein